MTESTTWRCVVADCDRPYSPKAAKGMCRHHYEKTLPPRVRRRGPCEADGCEKSARDRFCGSHEYLRKASDSDSVPRCLVEECASPAHTRGWCIKHYRPVSKYGLFPDALAALLARQGGGCAVCGLTELESGHPLNVDHDHACCPGKRSCGECVRGILCRACNVGLGNLRDSPELLLAAHAYLTRPRADR